MNLIILTIIIVIFATGGIYPKNSKLKQLRSYLYEYFSSLRFIKGLH